MNAKERETARGEYQRIYNEFVVGNKLIPPHYGTVIEGLTGVASLKDKMGIEGYQMACNGDFSMFETVDPILRNWMASNYERDSKQLPESIILNSFINDFRIGCYNITLAAGGDNFPCFGNKFFLT